MFFAVFCDILRQNRKSGGTTGSDFSKFRTAVSGFNRTDVVNYIESTSIEHQKALRKLTGVIGKTGTIAISSTSCVRR